MKNSSLTNSIRVRLLSASFLALSLSPVYGSLVTQNIQEQSPGKAIFNTNGNTGNSIVKISSGAKIVDLTNAGADIKFILDKDAISGKIEIMKQFNSPFSQIDRIDVTAYQNQSDKVKTREEEIVWYPDGSKKTHRIKTIEPIKEAKSAPGLFDNAALPGWLNTLLILFLGAGAVGIKYDIHGKIIKVIKWLINKIKAYWGSK